MGGANHQPCNRYLPISTQLSRYLSLARAELDLANVELEDVLLLELTGKAGNVQKIVDRLEASNDALTTSLRMAADLRHRMDDEQFNDLPTLRKVDLTAVGSDLCRINAVDSHSWNKIVPMMLKGGFYLVLGHFEESITEIQNKTTQLTTIIMSLKDLTENGELNVVLEENRLGNFKLEFAQLYSAWANFNQEFLASSICSTELWYSFNGFGSLTPGGVVSRAA